MIFDRNGNVEHEFFIDEDKGYLLESASSRLFFFIINFDDQLKLYSIEREDLLNIIDLAIILVLVVNLLIGAYYGFTVSFFSRLFLILFPGFFFAFSLVLN